MVKVKILTDITADGLQKQLTDWVSNGWHLHEGVVLTQWEDVKGLGLQGQAVIHASACGFLQVMTRAEGTCRAPQAPSESD